ncbi:MAG: type I DNA topoisomerase, partial [Candidatus Magasanikbacteria bacterium]|nr:type I DNA topoisomerase [Candidatus Magasanikbacteria bacterium]
MAKTLVIVESPTKAKTISKFLGKAYKVESSFGHLRDLPKSTMGVDIEGGTFLPSYVIPKEKAKQVKKLKDALKECDDVIFATDEDREGEAISWHLAAILKVSPEKTKRIVFHEITKHAIEEALAHPRTIDQKLVDAQQARRVLDRLVGYELSPFLWKKISRGLSAGRVQSVALRLVVERERERKAFVSEEYWKIEGLFHKDPSFPGFLHSIDGKKLDKFDLSKEKDTSDIVSLLEGATYTIDSLTKKEAKRNPPPPFRTSTLQQQANQKFGYSSRQTMRLAQQLYEGVSLGPEGSVGLITYMRTDSTNLSKKFISEVSSFVHDTYGKEYDIEKPRVYASKTKGAQEAHEAIRPTHAEKTPESIKEYLDSKQYKLYNLIWSRAVATQMAAAKINRTTMDIIAKKHTFRATGQSMLFPGYLTLYPNAIKETMLPDLNEGDKIDCVSLTPTQHFTEPPARYSDATLVKVLEEYGIGRPSTYAPTIGTIEAREYVERDENKRLAPRDVAFIVIDLLVEHFSQIVDFHFTAQVEENLDAIAHGTKDWQPIISTFYHPFHENLMKKTDEVSRDDISQTREVGIDPETGKPISVRIGRFGPYVQKGTKDDEEKPKFASIPKDKRMDDITLADALHLLSLPKTLKDGETEEKITTDIGRFGPYVKKGKSYYSLKGTDLDPYTITLEQALQVIADGEEKKEKKKIKLFEGTDIQILNGPYGPYVTDGTKNARIPKDVEDP